MKRPQRKVVWSEGLFLEPHHFQQLERYLEHYADARARGGVACEWGFERLKLDESALNLGQVAVLEARGIFPDGTVFDFPSTSQAPAAIDIPRETRNLTVVLAIPASRIEVPEVDPFGTTHGTEKLRHVPKIDGLKDAASTASREIEVQFAELAPCLLLTQDPPAGYVSLGVAHVIERSATNRITLDTQYIWPALSCRDQPLLSGFIREVRGLLDQRGKSLAASLGQPGPGGVGAYAEFIELCVLNRYVPLFSHLAKHPVLHPERLYSTFLTLAGELSTFSTTDRLPVPLPDYDHDNLQLCFAPLVDVIRNSFRRTIDPNVVRVELQDRGYGYRLAVVNNKDLFSVSEFVLSVSAHLPTEELRSRFLNQVTLAPAERLVRLVEGHIPGIGLRVLPAVPPQIPFHAGASYFALEREGDFWRTLGQSSGLALHVPDTEFPGLRLECWAIKS